MAARKIILHLFDLTDSFSIGWCHPRISSSGREFQRL